MALSLFLPEEQKNTQHPFAKIYIKTEHFAHPKCSLGTHAYPQVIRNTLAMFEVSYRSGFRSQCVTVQLNLERDAIQTFNTMWAVNLKLIFMNSYYVQSSPNAHNNILRLTISRSDKQLSHNVWGATDGQRVLWDYRRIYSRLKVEEILNYYIISVLFIPQI